MKFPRTNISGVTWQPIWFHLITNVTWRGNLWFQEAGNCVNRFVLFILWTLRRLKPQWDAFFTKASVLLLVSIRILFEIASGKLIQVYLMYGDIVKTLQLIPSGPPVAVSGRFLFRGLTHTCIPRLTSRTICDALFKTSWISSRLGSIT